MAEHIIEIQDLRKAFQGNPILKGINLNVDASQLTVLIGPSGCGKSTLLRCLNGLEIFDEGRISVNGLTVLRDPGHSQLEAEFQRITHQLRAMVGMVFQSFNLFPHMTTLENVSRPPTIVQGISPREARVNAHRLLEKVGLKDKAGLYPAQLSGGQQQRAAIARALAMKPRVLLYDEPTSALDPALVDEVLEVMKELDAEGVTQVVVTHEMRFARDVAEKVVFLSDGCVVEEGEPKKIFTDPDDTRTRQFLKRFL
ncbi:MAG TPA: amino acid ABC transporter ATP-binding protein [Acidobacteriota bacterium]|nr:amino acid ABC transporter ATP-binding protein [Acidobacteriota bacterium]